ncbi:hypothetical protein [Endozoicomonas elysicola]|uniref:hypothetical protein n=1 Tax=Endozoicomonas elysicola TaxID=305900 RepID=UPI000369B86F|nr:hypothetical protein [Endozoicomonas elysicola]
MIEVLSEKVKWDPVYLKSCQKTLIEFIELQSRYVSKPYPVHKPTPATPTGQLSTLRA